MTKRKTASLGWLVADGDRKPGMQRVALPGKPGDEGFIAAYHAASNGLVPAPTPVRPASAPVSWSAPAHARAAKLSNTTFFERAAEIGRVVYFILAARRVQIGVASDLRDRLRAIQTGCPVVVRVLGIMAGGLDVERQVHERLSDHREHGEWFSLSAEVKRFIRENCIV